LTEYENKSICAFNLIKLYLEATRSVRDGEDHLLLSFIKPHKAATVDTVRRWIVTVLSLAGINTNIFKAHSTRGASSSKANFKKVPLVDIIKAGRWASKSTFAKFYNRTIVNSEKTRLYSFPNGYI
jgi:hypothetical protein